VSNLTGIVSDVFIDIVVANANVFSGLQRILVKIMFERSTNAVKQKYYNNIAGCFCPTLTAVTY
jgi:hypothetical protein